MANFHRIKIIENKFDKRGNTRFFNAMITSFDTHTTEARRAMKIQHESEQHIKDAERKARVQRNYELFCMGKDKLLNLANDGDAQALKIARKLNYIS